MKKNQKGFTLVETLIVSSFVVGVLIYIFSQFVILRKGYNNTFTYNTVEGIYGAKNIDRYLANHENDKVRTLLNGKSYIEITNCTGFNNTDYCNTLFSKLNVKTVLVVTNMDTLRSDLKTNNPYSEGIYQFITTKKEKKDESGYRLIVEYKDDTFSSILLSI